MTDYQKLLMKTNRITGEFQGTLEAILFYDIPKDLKDKLSSKVTELKAIDYSEYIKDETTTPATVDVEPRYTKEQMHECWKIAQWALGGRAGYPKFEEFISSIDLKDCVLGTPSIDAAKLEAMVKWEKRRDYLKGLTCLNEREQSELELCTEALSDLRNLK